jgi:hypothetical protein
MFAFLSFGSPSPFKLPAYTADLSFEENYALLCALGTAVTLFLFSNHFFWPFDNGQLGEYLYSAQAALNQLLDSNYFGREL